MSAARKKKPVSTKEKLDVPQFIAPGVVKETTVLNIVSSPEVLTPVFMPVTEG